MATSVSFSSGAAAGRWTSAPRCAPRTNGIGKERVSFPRAPVSSKKETSSRFKPSRLYATSESITDVSEAVHTLKAVADGKKKLPSGDIVKALSFIEKNKMKTTCPTKAVHNKFDEGELDELIGGTASPGKAWRLVFTADKDAFRAVVKGEADKGGFMFPITAVQLFDASAKTITNGVYLGFIAAVKFSGNFETKKNALNFKFDNMEIKVGPAKFNITPKSQSGAFVFFYADDELIVARGQSGGTAFWRKPSPTWLAEKGVV